MPSTPDSSPILGLPFIQPSQAQKHVTHNEAIQTLDILVQTAVEEVGATSPPATPATGTIYALGAGATGEWAGQDGKLAARLPEAWIFLTPLSGWHVFNRADGRLHVFDGSAWKTLSVDLQNLPGLGVGTSFDSSNRLSVRSPNTLFSHDGTGHQLKINKASTSNTASLLFQTNWTGKAEMGLNGNDDFSIKVGATFADALIAFEHGNYIKSGKSIAVGTDVPSDLWSYGAAPQSVLFMNHGYFGHNGSFEQGLWWNGYRNAAAGWTSLGLNGWTSGAGIALGNAGIRFMWQSAPTGSSPAEIYRMEATSLRPIADNARQLGTASARWSQVFSGSGTINTSDARRKVAVPDDGHDDAEARAAQRIRKSIRKYRLADSIKAKGDKARIHFGVYAQEVQKILRDEGLEPFAYAFLCCDELEEEVWEKDAEGELVAHTRKTGEVVYGIRYDELAMFLLMHA